MNFRRINRTDLIVIGAVALILTAFLVNTKLNSIIPLYFSDLIVLGVFTYWAIRKDATGMLLRGLIIGGIGGFFYTFVDKLFVELRTITYIGGTIKDIEVFATPLSVVLLWIGCIAIAMYIYQRLRSFFGRFYIPALLISISAFLAVTVLSNLGDRLWVWSFGATASPGIGSTPLFVPVAFFFTFLLSPYIMGGQRISRRLKISDNPITAGLRCAVILSIMVYLCFIIFTGYGRIGFGG